MWPEYLVLHRQLRQKVKVGEIMELKPPTEWRSKDISLGKYFVKGIRWTGFSLLVRTYFNTGLQKETHAIKAKHSNQNQNKSKAYESNCTVTKGKIYTAYIERRQ